MADEDRTFDPSQAQVNRGREQGLGVGQKELDLQRDPDGEMLAIDPERTEPFNPEGSTPGPRLDDRNSAGYEGETPLGEGTPSNVDIHKLGQDDNPEADWGEPANPEAAYSANHTRRPGKTEGERGQGPRTRQANKDIISRRT